MCVCLLVLLMLSSFLPRENILHLHFECSCVCLCVSNTSSGKGARRTGTACAVSWWPLSARRPPAAGTSCDRPWTSSADGWHCCQRGFPRASGGEPDTSRPLRAGLSIRIHSIVLLRETFYKNRVDHSRLLCTRAAPSGNTRTDCIRPVPARTAVRGRPSCPGSPHSPPRGQPRNRQTLPTPAPPSPGIQLC